MIVCGTSGHFGSTVFWTRTCLLRLAAGHFACRFDPCNPRHHKRKLGSQAADGTGSMPVRSSTAHNLNPNSSRNRSQPQCIMHSVCHNPAHLSQGTNLKHASPPHL